MCTPYTFTYLPTEKLANTERSLDVAKGHSQKADDKTDELKQLNRSIFRPVITWNKDSKRAAQESKIQARYDEEREEREKAMMDIRESQNRVGRAATYGQDEEGIGGRSGQKNESQIAAMRAQRSRYQFEAAASDDEMEDELDGNLDEIGDIAKRLKAMGTAMGQELDNQNKRIERIDGKAVGLDNRLFRNTERVSDRWGQFVRLGLILFLYSSRRSSNHRRLSYPSYIVACSITTRFLNRTILENQDRNIGVNLLGQIVVHLLNKWMQLPSNNI